LAGPGETTIWTIAGALVGALGLGTFIGWYFQETLKRLVRSPQQTARTLETRDIVPSEGTHFTILIADLEGDDDNLSQTKHVETALREQEGLEVVLVGPGPSPFQKGSRIEYQLRTESEGRAILAHHNGDLLIWGEVAQANTRVRLRFLGRTEDAQGKHGSYQLEAAELPKSFGEDFGTQLSALALASLAPATEQQGHYLVDLLKQPAAKLERLLERGSPGLDPGQCAQLQLALGNAASVIGEQSGKTDWLSKAVAAYRGALEERTRARVPLDWAMTQNNLGGALQTLGERESGTARLEEAVAAYRAALEEHTRERVPLDWAMTQNNLGNALQRLGERESGAAHLAEAVAAYRAALEERTRERVPLDWAMTQNNLGSALQALSERESGTARLEEAVAAYRAALEEWTRERVPLNWAGTQSNLGNALKLLGLRESGTARLEEAVAACRAALEERTLERYPFLWALTQENVGLALQVLGEREGSEERLGQAVAAIRGALDVFEQSDAGYNIEKARNNPASAGATLARLRGSDTAASEEQ
jgi:tetratricopeptide (TPR) repeat protein